MKHTLFNFLETKYPVVKRSTEQKHYGHLDSPRDFNQVFFGQDQLCNWLLFAIDAGV